MTALIVVDAQNDFFEGGALAVPHSNEIIDTLNRLIDQHSLVFFTQDWHPALHRSFASQHPGRQPFDLIDLNGLPQVLWPDHCVQHQTGADFKTEIHFQPHRHPVVRKGSDCEVDSYSGFFDNGGQNPTELHALLAAHHVRRVVVCGLAADYCVKYTALDAARLGYDTIFLTDATRPVVASQLPAVLLELQQAGVRTVASEELAGC